MSAIKSEEAYTIEKLNCAQSIYKGYQEKYNISQEVIDHARKLGGGRAEEGTCGALYAALQLIDSSEKRDELIIHFTNYTKTIKCREIRQANDVSCKECVTIAAKFLENHL